MILQNISKLILAAAAAVFTVAVSCDCPTDTGGLKIIEPKEFAKVLFVNAIPDSPEIDVVYGSEKSAEKLASDAEYAEYSKFPSGDSDLELVSPDEAILFRAATNYEKDKFYSTFFAGSSVSPVSASFSDTLEGVNSQSAYFKFAHLATGAPDVKFKLSGDYSIETEMAYLDADKVRPVYAGSFLLEALDASSGEAVAGKIAVDLENGTISVFILQNSAGSDEPFLRRVVVPLP